MSAGSISSMCARWWRASRTPFAFCAASTASRASRIARSPIACTWIWKPSLSRAVARAWKAAGSRLGLPRSPGKPTYGSSTEAVRVSRTPSAKILTELVRSRLPAYFARSALSRGTSAVPLSVSQWSEASTRAESCPRASSVRYASSSSVDASASTSAVRPNRLAIRRPSRKPSAYSFALRSGRSFATRSAASSRSVPLGSPVAGSRSIRPYGGSGVAFVIPARARAFELTQTECPSVAERYTGRSARTASRSVFDGFPSGKSVSSQPPPRIQAAEGCAAA